MLTKFRASFTVGWVAGRESWLALLCFSARGGHSTRGTNCCVWISTRTGVVAGFAVHVHYAAAVYIYLKTYCCVHVKYFFVPPCIFFCLFSCFFPRRVYRLVRLGQNGVPGKALRQNTAVLESKPQHLSSINPNPGRLGEFYVEA